MRFAHCTYDTTAREILDIFNDAILNTTALYDYQPRSLETMAPWFKVKETGSYPVIGAFDEVGHLLGFASYGAFRNWPAYKYTVEHSVYIHKEHRGKGIGLALMQKLIKEAKKQQYHIMVGGIDASNQASISLHERLGFFHAGTIKHAGFKFSRWLDLAFYQLVLETPPEPIDG
ncbi:GNAT family N-acetyltransferase [Billgrantia endophytica]|uniref:GNAT family N-acetyltransferase n=1 Tax=Billgrantia endophytica TaxID=2033802 RepID=A0A2N7TWH3_9GAMM|nr:GNAT family N-acetyltransferase [Halomonas endophytica]PMR72534.1 GNAT family N-acetyltransferase [Halomonas endophytica]